MRRRVVQQGPTTLMVSLPIKWVRRNGLRKGDELEVTERGRSLLVRTQSPSAAMAAELVLDTQDELYLWRRLQPLYALGYTEITVRSGNPKVLSLAQQLAISSLIGFEAVGHTQESVTLRAISAELDEHFPLLCKRVFLNLLQMSTLLAHIFERKGDLDSLLAIELSNNRHTLFLKRVLLRGDVGDSATTAILYSIVVFLEKIANEFKYLGRHIANTKVSARMRKAYPRIEQLLKDVSDQFAHIHERRTREIILKAVRAEDVIPLANNDPIVGHHFIAIIDFARSVLFQLMALHAQEERAIRAP